MFHFFSVDVWLLQHNGEPLITLNIAEAGNFGTPGQWMFELDQNDGNDPVITLDPDSFCRRSFDETTSRFGSTTATVAEKPKLATLPTQETPGDTISAP